MEQSLVHKTRAVVSVALFCWMSSTALSSPAFSEMLTLTPGDNSRSAYRNNPSENPYEQRRAQIKERAEAAALPSPDLLKEAPVQNAKLQPVEAPKAEPMKITIPNLKAMEASKSAPTLLAEQNAHSYTPPPTALPPPAQLHAAAPERKRFTNDPERQTVAEFKPVAVVTQPPEEALAAIAPPVEPQLMSEPEIARAEERTANAFSALAPAAGPDNAAPLIATPDSAAPTPPAAAAPVAPPPPTPPPIAAAPPAAPTVVAPPPPVAEIPPPPEATAPPTTPTQALDTELQKPVVTFAATDARSEIDGELPSLEPKTTAKSTSKTGKKKIVKDDVAQQSKPYSPLDSEPLAGLSKASEATIKKLPANIGKPKAKPEGPFEVERAKDVSGVITHEAMGIKIAVSKPAVNLDYELEKAYEALSAGQPSMAIQIYKNILENDPNNKGALFGLATTFHRSGQLDQARTYYTKLLALDPNHRDGLNNFLVLIADEAPEEALVKMAELETRNPDFSPIPAQMAVIYQRLGNTDKATEKMFRAIELSPENLVYRYNLAIMLDRQKKYDEAARLYKQLVQSAMRGEVIPGNLQKIQQRLTFIGSNRR